MRITSAIENFVSRQRLGFLATVCPDGTPNVSPKGLTFVLDQNHLVIGEVRSPRSVSNLRLNPVAEVNVVDVVSRKGYRFKGSCTILESGPEFERLLEFLRAKGATSEIHSIIVMTVETLGEVVSPVYDSNVSEEKVRREWKKRLDQQNEDLLS